jgi:hypothetical protein
LDFSEFRQLLESHRARKEVVAGKGEQEADSELDWKKRFELKKKKPPKFQRSSEAFFVGFPLPSK